MTAADSELQLNSQPDGRRDRSDRSFPTLCPGWLPQTVQPIPLVRRCPTAQSRPLCQPCVTQLGAAASPKSRLLPLGSGCTPLLSSLSSVRDKPGMSVLSLIPALQGRSSTGQAAVQGIGTPKGHRGWS